MPHQRIQLIQYDDDTDAAHKAGENRVWDKLDVLADPKQAEDDLKATGQQECADDNPQPLRQATGRFRVLLPRKLLASKYSWRGVPNGRVLWAG